MMQLGPGTQVWLSCRPTDMRKSFDGLAAEVKWWLEKAEKGQSAAQFAMGRFYEWGQEGICESGKIITRDYVRAYMWFDLAAATAARELDNIDNNYPLWDYHQTNYKSAVSRRDQLAEKMTTKQIIEAERLAREWKPIKPQATDTSGIRKLVLNNLISHYSQPENKAFPINLSEALDIGLGCPVSAILRGEYGDTPLPYDLTDAYRNGTASDFGEFMQSIIPAAAEVVEKFSKDWKKENPIKNKFSFLLCLVSSGTATLSTFALLCGVGFLVMLLQRGGQEPAAQGAILILFPIWVVLVGGLLAIALKALPNYKLNSLPYLIFGALTLITGLHERETQNIWAGLITLIFGLVVRNFSWNASEYSMELNIRWAWLRAVEWIGWPLFVTQPLIPVFLYFYPWYWVLALVTAITFLWRVFICPKIISPGLVAFGALFVLFKFITSPVMAYVLWQRGDMAVAALALFWPLIGTIIIAPLLGIIQGLTGTARTLDIGPVQNRLLRALGFDRKDSWARTAE